MDWVLDCSFALAWALPDERSAIADRFLASFSGKSILWVSPLWWFELSNALTVAHRRKRIQEVDLTQILELYGNLSLQTDSRLDLDVVWHLCALAREYGLPAYDAAYLELVQRRGAGLATFDDLLTRAARKAGVKLV